MDPVAALREIAFYKDRARQESRRVMAYRKAADVVEALTPEQREKLGRTNSWQTLAGVGPKTAAVIAQAWAGREPDALVQLRTAAADLGGGELRTALKGTDIQIVWPPRESESMKRLSWYSLWIDHLLCGVR